MQEKLRLDISNRTATITIDDPETRNALSGETLDLLGDACRSVAADEIVRVVVVRGGGDRVFVSGGNIAEVNKAVGGEHKSPGAAAMLALGTITKPVVAAINGHCLGGGLLVALSADIRIAVDTATFGIPAVRLGVAYPQAGVDLLVQEVGASRARELLIMGDRIDAEAAASIGLIHQSVATDEFDNAVDQAVATLLGNAPLSMQASKASVKASADRAGADTPGDAAARHIADAWASDDAKEGTAAFLEKRPAQFEGK